jgi:3-phytase
LVRRFGAFSRLGAAPGEIGEIEAVVVDDELGYVYYADERYGIRKYHADPRHPDAGRELAGFARDGYVGDREGLAIFARRDGTGYVVSADQIPGGTVFRFYAREGTPNDPHDHTRLVHQVITTADSTDGLEVTAVTLPGFPAGLLVAMNSGPRNFALFRWDRLVSGPR